MPTEFFIFNFLRVRIKAARFFGLPPVSHSANLLLLLRRAWKLNPPGDKFFTPPECLREPVRAEFVIRSSWRNLIWRSLQKRK